MKSVRLTTGQAVIRFMAGQDVERDGQRLRFWDPETSLGKGAWRANPLAWQLQRRLHPRLYLSLRKAR